jgi:hypothetical protein
MDEMFIGSMVDVNEVQVGRAVQRALARARRRPPRRLLTTPEYRALDQIVAAAQAQGNLPVVLGPSGILEVRTPHPLCGIRQAVLRRRGPIDVESISGLEDWAYNPDGNESKPAPLG